MATLQIDALRVVGVAGTVSVSITLTDADGRRVDGFTSSGVIVKPYSGRTDATGSLDVDLTPNATITPANTYYTVVIAARSFLISKGAATETLEDALAVSPVAMTGIATLGGLDDVDTSGAADNDVLTYDLATDTWTAEAPTGGGGGVTSVSGTAPITSSGGATPAIGITAATSGAAGSMSAADKTKLDGIEAGATADQSASEILAKVVTVDGTGSGLDADTVDGQHASAFEAAGTAAALVDDLSGVSNAATARTNLGLGDSSTRNVGTTAGTVAAGDHNHSGVYDPAGTAAGLVDDLSGVSNAATARTNLGLGTAAVVDTGTGATNAILGNDSRLSDARTPTAHAASHAPGGSDALAWTTVHGYGLASARPAAAASNAGYVYLASDTGTLSRSNGSTWDDLLKAGTGATNYTAGNDSRLSDSRAPSGSAGGDLSGTYPSPSVVAASDTTAGKVELATAAETTTGTDTGRAVTPDGLAGSEYGVEVVEIMASDMTTAITTGDGKAGFVVPAKLNGWNLIRANAALLGAVSSSGDPAFQIRNATDSQDMLSTKITIDANEYTSYTAATPSVVNGSYDDVATGDRLMVDVDVAGTGAKGLLVILEFQLP